MRGYDVFFFGAFFFLLGVLAASFGAAAGTWWFAFGAAALCIALRFFRGGRLTPSRWDKSEWIIMAALLFFAPMGATYYTMDDARFLKMSLPEGERTFRAEVVGNPSTTEGTQSAVWKLDDSGLRVLVKLPAYPRFFHGDHVTFTGRVEEPFSDSYRTYLAKERVRGTVAFPRVLAHESGDWSLRGSLYAFREKIVGSFRRTLPANEAALMAGITVGAREDFTQEFRDAMAASGTTHITALSGYNISVLIAYVLVGLLSLFSRRIALAGTIAVVCAFVLMTGAEASVVRAAVMGSIVLLAAQGGRVRDMRNVILFAALAMVLANPKVLAFDLGFQLSFLALLGIVYLKPSLDKVWTWGKRTEGPFSWRENLTTTVAAQCAVAPLLIHMFGSVSVSSLAANVLVLEVVPLTMGMGFVLAGVSFVSSFFANIVAFVPLFLLKFQVFVIELFSRLSIPVSSTLSGATVVGYYAALLFFIAYVHRNRFIPRRK